MERRPLARRDGEIIFLNTPCGGGAPIIFWKAVCGSKPTFCAAEDRFFLDQRENRREVETLAPAARAECVQFFRGFSVYAARGATAATDLDISAHALAAAQRNFALNKNCPGVRVSSRHAQAMRLNGWQPARRNSIWWCWIRRRSPGAPRNARAPSALTNGWPRWHCGSRPAEFCGGSCSAHVPAEEFLRSSGARRRSREKICRAETLRHPPDHPATFKEAEYLKVIYLKFAT